MGRCMYAHPTPIVVNRPRPEVKTGTQSSSPLCFLSVGQALKALLGTVSQGEGLCENYPPVTGLSFPTQCTVTDVRV